MENCEAIATGSAPTHIPVVFDPVSVFSFLPYEDEKKHESQTTAATKCLRLKMQQSVIEVFERLFCTTQIPSQPTHQFNLRHHC